MYNIMDGSKKIMVTSAPYQFQIIDNTLFSRDKTEIYSRNFKIGGTYPDCVNISIIYENNKPVDASIPSLLNDPECSFIRPLEKGGGVIIMIKTLLNYVYTQLPTLTHIKFDDKSSIECATEEELKKVQDLEKKEHMLNLCHYTIFLYYLMVKHGMKNILMQNKKMKLDINNIEQG